MPSNPINDDLTNPHIGGPGRKKGFSHNNRRLKRDAIPSDYEAIPAHTGKTEHYKDLDETLRRIEAIYGKQEEPTKTRRGRTGN